MAEGKVISETTKARVESFLLACKAGKEIFEEKNTEYGDSIRFGGVLAACYEIVGAAMRLPTLVFHAPDHGRSKSESLYNILVDIHNYANIAIMLMKEDNWEGKF
jgi:hypothetical protein